MSRSYKHTPVCKRYPSSKRGNAIKYIKRRAAKLVRKDYTINQERKTWKLLISSYEVHDEISRCSWKRQVERHYNLRNRSWYRSMSNYYTLSFNRWAKYHLRK